MERRAGSRREQIGEKQTRAELKNKQKRVDRLRRADEPVPTVLLDRVAELQQRLIK